VDEARVGALNRTVPATVYEDYHPASRQSYADSLSCPGCGQPAYFIRTASNGRAACFGARPHTPDCPLATTTITDDEPALTARDVLVIQPVTDPTTPTPPRDEPDPRRAAGAVPRTSSRSGGAGRRSLGLDTLLRRLIRTPAFRDSDATLVLPGTPRGSIRTLCVEAIEVDLSLQNQRRLYWGTIRYAHSDEDGVWFNLGRTGAPTLRLNGDTVTGLLDRTGAPDVEDLQGASFLAYVFLRRARTSERMFLFIDDLDWFALRLPDQDPI
jgi:hypothetical protein